MLHNKHGINYGSIIMRKIALLLLLSLIVLDLPALSVCPIQKIKNCRPIEKQQSNPQPQQLKEMNKLKNLPKTNSYNSEDNVYYSASCEFGICQPKPPKR